MSDYVLRSLFCETQLNFSKMNGNRYRDCKVDRVKGLFDCLERQTFVNQSV